MQNGADNEDIVVRDMVFENFIAEGVHFDCATLAHVIFRSCDMYWASFFLAHLADVTFDQCDLRGADFKEATFVNVQFLDCDVGTDAIGGETQFDDTDLTGVKFERCRGR